MKLWFKAKNYGWGWTPASWEGWAATGLQALLFALGMVVFMRFMATDPANAMGGVLLFLAWNGVLAGGLIWLCFAKGEAPEWRWGKKAAEEPLNDFERLFAKAMKDPSAREGFYMAFLHSDLYVSGSMRGPGEAELQYYDLAGEKVLPVFSHPERLRKTLGLAAPELKFKGSDLIQNVSPGKAFALNPYSDFGREFSAAELSEILEKA